MATAFSWLNGTVLLFITFGVAACSALGTRRRPRFYARFAAVSLTMFASASGLALAINSSTHERAFGIGWLLLLLASLAAPYVFCYQRSARSRGSSDGDGGGGLRSEPPQPPPVPPSGGAPLPDADQARVRRRDHHRPSLRQANGRRVADKPLRRRTPAGPGSTG